MDSDGDEIDDDTKDVIDDSATNYYVWYAVNVDVSPAEPRDTLTMSCHCLVSTLSFIRTTVLLPREHMRGRSWES